MAAVGADLSLGSPVEGSATTSLLAEQPLDEAAVLRRVRRGDRHAYGLLYERHLAGARRVARSLVRDPADVDDVVAEAFASAFAAMRRGRGPVDVFGPYIHSCVRNECRRSWGRERGRIRTDGDDEVVAETTVRRDGRADEFGHLAESEVVREALDAMPARLRAVLWHTEVDELSHATIARMTGSTPQAVAAMAMRARRSFGDRYLQAHLATDADDLPTECARVRDGLAEVVRGSASARRCRATAQHLSTCSSCATAQDNLKVVNERLRTVPLFALVTGRGLSMLQLGAKARLLAWVTGPAVELAAAGGLAFVVALAPQATGPSAAAAAATPPDAAAIATVDGPNLSPPPLAPMIVELAPDDGGTVRLVLPDGLAGAATTATAGGVEQLASTGVVGAGAANAAAPGSTPSSPATGLIGASTGAATGQAEPELVAVPIVAALVGAIADAALGGAVLPAVVLPPLALPELSVTVQPDPLAPAAGIDVAIPVPGLDVGTPGGGQATVLPPANIGGSAGASADLDGGTGQVGGDVDVPATPVGGPVGGAVDGAVDGVLEGEPEVDVDAEVPIVGEVELEVDPGGLLPGG